MKPSNQLISVIESLASLNCSSEFVIYVEDELSRQIIAGKLLAHVHGFMHAFSFCNWDERGGVFKRRRTNRRGPYFLKIKIVARTDDECCGFATGHPTRVAIVFCAHAPTDEIRETFSKDWGIYMEIK